MNPINLHKTFQEHGYDVAVTESDICKTSVWTENGFSKCDLLFFTVSLETTLKGTTETKKFREFCKSICKQASFHIDWKSWKETKKFVCDGATLGFSF